MSVGIVLLLLFAFGCCAAAPDLLGDTLSGGFMPPSDCHLVVLVQSLGQQQEFNFQFVASVHCGAAPAAPGSLLAALASAAVEIWMI